MEFSHSAPWDRREFPPHGHQALASGSLPVTRGGDAGSDAPPFPHSVHPCPDGGLSPYPTAAHSLVPYSVVPPRRSRAIHPAEQPVKRIQLVVRSLVTIRGSGAVKTQTNERDHTVTLKVEITLNISSHQDKYTYPPWVCREWPNLGHRGCYGQLSRSHMQLAPIYEASLHNAPGVHHPVMVDRRSEPRSTACLLPAATIDCCPRQPLPEATT